MNCDAFEKTFEKGSYYPGYFSNEELTDLTQKNIAMTISKEDLTKTSRQLRLSMGGMAVLFQGFGVIMFALLLYLLSKVVISQIAFSSTIHNPIVTINETTDTIVVVRIYKRLISLSL